MTFISISTDIAPKLDKAGNWQKEDVHQIMKDTNSSGP